MVSDNERIPTKLGRMSSPTYTINKPGALFFIAQWECCNRFHTRIPLYQNLSDVVVCFSEIVWLDLFDDGIYDGEYTTKESYFL